MLLPPASVLDFVPAYRSTQTPWQALTPVAAWLVADLSPARIVELGSYRGDSFFAFLEAAAHNPAIRDLVAIDSWIGDQHTGEYDTAVLDQFNRELSQRADPRARSIRGLFSEAVQAFDDRSIDLLHIDGAHDYLSVKQDFETWLPKMAPDGVVLLHDTMVLDNDFGVWKLWAEIEKQYPGRCFNFEHSNGLGIVCLGTSDAGQIRAICRLQEVETRIVKDVMNMAGQRITDLRSFEYDLLKRNGGDISLEYEFARGEARVTMEKLMHLRKSGMQINLQTTLDDRIGKLISEQADDIYASIKPKLVEEVDERIAQLVTGRANDLYAAIKPKLTEELNARADYLLSAQANDLYAAIKPKLSEELDARAEQLLSSGANDVYAALKPKLTQELDARDAQLVFGRGNDIYSAIKPNIAADLEAQLKPMTASHEFFVVKNEAQDDVIFSMSAKLEAHEAAIHELAKRLR